MLGLAAPQPPTQGEVVMDSGKCRGGHKEKGRKIAFLGIDRDVERAGETAKETEMGID